MPKQKTHKGTKKRIHITATGKILRRKRVFGSKTKARTATKRSNRKMVSVKRQDRRVIKRLLPGT